MKKNNIKNRAAYGMISLIAFLTGIAFQACNKEESSGGGKPVVSYIRVTDVNKSDSLVVHAFMGNTIAIMGNNLGNVNEIWFNDQQAYVNMAFVTQSTIIVTIPNVIPAVVTNSMKLITSNKKDTTVVPFGVDVPAPFLESMLCEYVKDNETAVIKGNFFIDDPNIPIKVIFPGNVEGTVEDVSLKEIKVKVPAGSGVGPIVVKSLYGSSRSTFYFRDDRNIILNFDNLTAAGGWRSGKIGNSNPDPISGNYVRFSGTMAGKSGATWNEDDFSFDLWPIANGRSQVPVYSGDLAKAQIKFEINVYADWSSSALQMIFTPYATNNTNSYIGDAGTPRGLWMPWQEKGTYKTNGWITVSIPLSSFKYKGDGGTCANPLTPDMLYGLTFFVWNGGVNGTDCTPGIAIDNIRVVPIN